MGLGFRAVLSGEYVDGKALRWQRIRIVSGQGTVPNAGRIRFLDQHAWFGQYVHGATADQAGR